MYEHFTMSKTLEEPLIISWGRQHISSYETSEFVQSFYKAFIVHRADYVTLDSLVTGQRFLAASTAWALDNGFLSHTKTADEGQSEIYEFRITEKGRQTLTSL